MRLRVIDRESVVDYLRALPDYVDGPGIRTEVDNMVEVIESEGPDHVEVIEAATEAQAAPAAG